MYEVFSFYFISINHATYLCRQNVTAYTVTVGTYYLSSSTNPGISYSARELIWHPKYDARQIHYDIGLIRLNDWIFFITKRIEVIPLVSVYNIPTKEIAIVTGWGKLSVSLSTI